MKATYIRRAVNNHVRTYVFDVEGIDITVQFPRVFLVNHKVLAITLGGVAVQAYMKGYSKVRLTSPFTGGMINLEKINE